MVHFLRWHGPIYTFGNIQCRAKDLRCGDFDGNGTTDVLGIIAGKWMVSYSGTSAWTALPKSLTGTMDGVVVADFDGDGRAEIATAFATSPPYRRSRMPHIVRGLSAAARDSRRMRSSLAPTSTI